MGLPARLELAIEVYKTSVLPVKLKKHIMVGYIGFEPIIVTGLNRLCMPVPPIAHIAENITLFN